MWWEKVNWVSNVTPNTRGVLSRGRGEPRRGTVGWRLNWWVSGVKRVTDDFGAESKRPLSSTQDTTSEAWLARVSAAN